jgi:hypothetical protein
MRLQETKRIARSCAGALALLLGCAGAPPPPALAPAPAPPKAAAPEPPAKEPLATGSDCVHAEAQCDGGECVLSIKNGCEQAISCDATMTTTCKSSTDMIEAARRKRVTFAARTDGEIRLVGDCAGGEILRTAVQSILCK